MGPGLTPIEPEIVGIGDPATLAFLRLGDPEGNAVAGGIGHRIIARIKSHVNLALHVARGRIAHDRVDLPGAFRFKLENPILAVGFAGLHGCLRGTVNSCSHVPVPLHGGARLKGGSRRLDV